MKQLADYFESLLDVDFDTNDNDVFMDLVMKATGCPDHETFDAKIDGEWIVFDCTKWKVISIQSFAPLKAAGYTKYRFVNCRQVVIFPTDDRIDSWSDLEIDAPEAKVIFYGDTAVMGFTNIKINSRDICISPKENMDVEVVMKNCKFDIAMFVLASVAQLTIASTCKFTHCKLLFLGNVSKSIARKASGLLMCDTTNGRSFGKEVKTWKCTDKATYLGIDVMKTLGLKSKTWPDLGKIIIAPINVPISGEPGICLYKLDKAMLPISQGISKGPNNETAEFKDGWSGQHVKYAYAEMTGVTK